MRKPRGKARPTLRKPPYQPDGVRLKNEKGGRRVVPVCVLHGNYEYHYDRMSEALKEWVLYRLPFEVNSDGERVYTSEE